MPRRTVGVVEYPEDMVYKTYEEMDIHLAELHAPTFSEKETKMLGPFGVFVGIEHTGRRPRVKRKQSAQQAGPGASPTDLSLPRRSHLNRTHSAHSPSERSTPENSSFMTGYSPQRASVDHTPHGGANHQVHPYYSNHHQGYNHFGGVPTLGMTGTGPTPHQFASVPQRSEYETLHEELTTLLDANITGPNFFDLAEFDFDSAPSQFQTQEHLGLTLQPDIDIKMSDSDSDPTLNVQNPVDLTNDNNHSSFTANFGPEDKQAIGARKANGHVDIHTNSEEPDEDLKPAVIHHVPRVFVKAPETKISPILDVMNWKKDRYFLSDEARALLYHYDKNVIRTMSVVSHHKNPWKTIYLPRAYSAIGNMVGKGQTSLARNALLHALLAVSSFHVHTKVVGQNAAQKAYFYEMGVALRSEAYKYMTQCLKGDLSRQKYKDVVTAVLSMVTTDVMCGVMEDCQVHLAACQSVISLRHKTRKRTSRKALILQRICGFLSLLQKATVLDPDSVLGLLDVEEDDAEYNPSTSWMNIDLPDLRQTKHLTEEDHERRRQKKRARTESLSGTRDRSSSQVSMDDTRNSTPDTDNTKGDDVSQQQQQTGDLGEDDDDAELVSLQSLYGVPDSLVILFNETCRVSRQALYYRTDGDGQIPKKLEREVASVQDSLEAWQRTRYDFSAISFSGKVQEALRHHMLSFRDALLVYHYRLARAHSAQQVTAQVVSILEHFEAMMSINANNGEPVITPLLFGLFVGACDAVEPEHIDRYRRVCERMAIQGFGSYQTAYNVILEVWRRRRESVNGAEWWTVVREWNINIMLS